MIDYMKKNRFSFYQLHSKIDTTGDNNITRPEFATFLTKTAALKINPKEVSVVLNYFDQNGDNKISAKEFIDMMKRHANKTERKSVLNLRVSPNEGLT
jgi:Ca2+-binding EF-hand superfamily protein